MNHSPLQLRLADAIRGVPLSLLTLTAFLAPLVFFPGLTSCSNLPQQTFLALVCGPLAALWLAGLLTAPAPPRLRWSPTLLPLYLLFVWLTLALWGVAHNRYEGMLSWQQWAVAVAFLFLAGQLVNGSPARRNIMAALFAAGVVVALLGIAQHLFAFDLVPQLVPPAATFANKNNAVHFIVLIFPLGVGLLLLTGKRENAWLLALGLGLVLTYLIYTRTRAGWLAVTLELLLFAFWIFISRRQPGPIFSWNRNKTAAVLVALSLTVNLVQLTPQGYQPGFGAVAQRAASIGSLEKNSVRLAIWSDTLELIKENLRLGVGPGNFKVFFPAFQQESAFLHTQLLKDAHNDYLQVAAESGLPGVVLLLVFAGGLLVMIGKLLRRPAMGERLSEVAALAIAVLGFAVNAAFDFPLQMMIPLFTLMLLLACLGSYFPRELLLPAGSRAVIVMVLSALVIGWPLLLERSLRHLNSSHFMMNAIIYDYHQHWEPARHNAIQALRLNPANVKIHTILGRVARHDGDYETALDHFQQVYQAYPYDYHTLADLGQTCLEQGDYEAAHGYFATLGTMFPRDGLVQNVIGLVYQKQGNLAAARQQFQRALAVDPKNSAIYLGNLAVLPEFQEPSDGY